MLMSYQQFAGEKHNLMLTNKSFENVAKFIYLVRTVTNQNCILEEIMSRLNLQNICDHLVQNLCLSISSLKWSNQGSWNEQMGEIRNAYKIMLRKPEGKSHLEYLVVDGRLIY